MRFSCTNYAFITFDLKKQNFHLCTQTPLHCSNLLLELQIFVYLLLQLSSNSLPTFTNVPFSFPHFFYIYERQSSCVVGARKWTEVWCWCDVIQIYVNGVPYLLISQHAVNFGELDE